MSSSVTPKNVRDYIVGNFNYFKNKVFPSPPYIKEQIAYRLFLCKDDCVPNRACKYCGCPPKKKVWLKDSCNKNERFGPLLDKEEWTKFKKENNITSAQIQI